MESNKILIKRKKKNNITKQEQFMQNLEEWASYWRANPHRFITDYLGLTLYDFQKVLIYMMFKYPKFIFIASRGLAKSTLSLIFAVAYAILYPHSTIVIVAPTKSQSTRFIKKIYDLKRNKRNLEQEIKKDGIKTSQNESKIMFENGSEIITVPYSENALGQRCNILIVDEFVRTEREVIIRVFVPFLTSPRTPEYSELTRTEREKIPIEQNRQLYLSSIRGADEWSYKYFETYIDEIEHGNTTYMTVALPYNFGVKNKYISKDTVEQSFKENQESTELLLAEYCCKPERGNENSFYKYNSLSKCRNVYKCMTAMSDEEYITYKKNKRDWPYYVEKLPNEIRLLCMDVALVESKKNDNTAFWIIRLIPDGGKYKKIAPYLETCHGVNSIIQAKRAKQLFYEMDCDYFVLDAQGNGAGVYDICTTETYDEERGEVYPAWVVDTLEDIGMTNRAISNNAIPIIHAVKTSIREKSFMLNQAKDIFTENDIELPVDYNEGLEWLNKEYKYYNIKDENLKVRLLNPYVQTSVFINEAINLERVIVQGYISAKEKSGKRKDRVMSLIYGLNYAKELEGKLNESNDYNFLDYIISC